MAEADRNNPSDAHDDLDLRSFYRDPQDTARQEPSRTTASVNIRDYLLPEDTAQPQAGNDPVPDAQLPHSLYSPPEWHPAEAAERGAREAAGSPPEAAQPTPLQLDSEPAAIEERDDLPPAHPEQASEDEFEDVSPPEPPKQSPIVRFATIGALLGIVFGAIIIGFTWVLGKPNGPYDLGTMTSSAVGLKGHLYTKWDDNKLQYRVSFTPTDPELHNAFALAVSNPPRPLSIGIQLKDAMGFVLCTKEILVKYDPAAALVASQSDKSASPLIDLAQSAAQEKQREQGNDLFQDQSGSDGQVDSINAQGQIPCTEQAYGRAVAWAFLPDFPSLVEQNQLLQDQAEKQTAAEREATARRHPAVKKVSPTLSYFIEGDEVLVGYDAPSGAMETNSAVEFLVDKRLPATTLAAWEAFPIPVHYRCDQNSNCTLARTGGATLQARLRR